MQNYGGFRFDFSQFTDTVGKLGDPSAIFDNLRTAIGHVDTVLASQIHAIVEARRSI